MGTSRSRIPQPRAVRLELDFDSGHKVFTFVTWTLEERGRRASCVEVS